LKKPNPKQLNRLLVRISGAVLEHKEGEQVHSALDHVDMSAKILVVLDQLNRSGAQPFFTAVKARQIFWDRCHPDLRPSSSSKAGWPAAASEQLALRLPL
jgi:hypothetical protein